MPQYILDANTCIAFLRGTSTGLKDRMRTLAPERIGLSAIVVAELYYGAENSADVAGNIRIAEAFIQPYRVLPFDAECAKAYGTIRSALKEQGQMIGANDLLTAATAIAAGATLVTHNTREFSRVPRLKFTDWEIPD